MVDRARGDTNLTSGSPGVLVHGIPAQPAAEAVDWVIDFTRLVLSPLRGLP
jgi:hypothetical protein